MEPSAVQFCPQTRRRSRLREVLEVAIAFALIEGALWSSGIAQLLWAAAAACWVGIATWRSGRTALELGLVMGGLRSSMWVVSGAAVVSGIVAGWAWWIGSLHVLTGARAPVWHVALYAVWALVQEFLALSFIFVRLRTALEDDSLAMLATAILFSLAHLPSPILMGTTFALALVLTALFRRYRNIYPLALAHAMLGLAIAVSVPYSMTHNMKVGIAYWK